MNNTYTHNKQTHFQTVHVISIRLCFLYRTFKQDHFVVIWVYAFIISTSFIFTRAKCESILQVQIFSSICNHAEKEQDEQKEATKEPCTDIAVSHHSSVRIIPDDAYLKPYFNKGSRMRLCASPTKARWPPNQNGTNNYSTKAGPNLYTQRSKKKHWSNKSRVIIFMDSNQCYWETWAYKQLKTGATNAATEYAECIISVYANV